MESHFFQGFMDELMKVAGGAKATIDPKTGKWVFKPVAMPKMKAPGAVPAPEPKFKPGSGFKPKGGGAFETGKSVVKGKSSVLVGGSSGQRKALRREGVFGM
ncbi:MAG: hypothetical protein GWN86_03005 [Desulfobacterales bacterium]|nr:hypothetical protein [Desulfobacterales bacterium]